VLEPGTEKGCTRRLNSARSHALQLPSTVGMASAKRTDQSDLIGVRCREGESDKGSDLPRRYELMSHRTGNSWSPLSLV
jgi:hypothetical protein